jgi:hypothetical protein
MKTKRSLGLMMLALAVMQAAPVQAVDMFILTWRGTLYYTNDAGKVVAKPYTERDVVNRIAANRGVSPSSMVLVYRPLYMDTAVVTRSSTGDWADYLQMPDSSNPASKTDMTNSGGTQTVRQAFLFDEDSTAIGTIFGMETQKWSSDGSTLISESFHGKFQFANTDPNNSLLPVGVVSGTFSTGARLKDNSGQ